MYYRMPDYYNNFTCIAGDCPCTCCSGWGIYIDDKTFDRYKSSEAKTKAYIMDHIDKEEQCFKTCNGRCSFLNDNKLCDLIIHEGEDMLCDTCRRYPRHFELYGDHVEAALSMSCPVAAELIINRKAPDRFKERSNDKKSGNAKEVDRYLLKVLLEVRENIFAIAMDRTKSIDQRMRDILLVAEQVQKVLYQYERMPVKIPFIAHKLLDKVSVLSKRCPKSTTSPKALLSRYQLMKEYSNMLLGLEMINDEWPALVNEVVENLYLNITKEQYAEYSNAFKEFLGDAEYEYEHILVYFLYTYFLGGVYDYNIIGMVKLSVLSTLFIREMSLSDFVKSGGKQTVEKRIENAYLYSRQVEHSDDNLIALEGILTTTNWGRFFCHEECPFVTIKVIGG